jgi:hypothetical protein
MAEQESKNKAVVRRFNEEWYNKRRLDLTDELCDERYSAPLANLHSREELKAMVKKAMADTSFTDTVTILDMFAEGNKVALRGRHPDGREEAELYTLANGKIVEHRSYWSPVVK